MSTRRLAANAMPPARATACRPGCAACCTAPSISSPIPGMPQGKLAGQPCVQLDAQGLCRLFGQPERPAVCVSLQPSADMCGSSREQALLWLGRLEAATRPDPGLSAETGEKRGYSMPHLDR